MLANACLLGTHFSNGAAVQWWSLP